MGDVIRIGIVSSMDKDTGSLQITYPDRNRMVTDDFPVICMGGEYSMPQVNDMVLVAHLSNDLSSGIVLGSFWNMEKVPEKADWYKRLSERTIITLLEDILKITAEDVVLESSAGNISVSELLDLKQRVADLEKRV